MKFNWRKELIYLVVIIMAIFIGVGICTVGIITYVVYHDFEIHGQSAKSFALQTLLTYKANVHDLDVRDYWLDEVNGCSIDEGCYAKKIYDKMRSFQYGLSGNKGHSMYDPMYVLENQNGQCSNFAYTYCRSLYQFDVDCIINCNNGHCWNNIYVGKTRLSCDKNICHNTNTYNVADKGFFVDVTLGKFYEIS